MFSFSYFILLAFASTTFAWSHLFERAPPGCIADNCLRALTGTQAGQKQTTADRAGDCTKYLVKTVTPDTVTVTATASFTSSATSSVYTTTTTTAPAYAIAVLENRAATVTPTTLPAYASPCSNIARYSSACNCAGWAATTTVTVPAPTTTVTISTTSTTTVDIVVSTSTSIAPAACTPSTTQTFDFHFGGGLQFTQLFYGTGIAERQDNPSAGGNAAKTSTFPASMAACDALYACAEFTAMENNCLNLDLHFLIAENEWLCAAYTGKASTSADWSVADPNIGASMGYQFVKVVYSK